MVKALKKTISARLGKDSICLGGRVPSITKKRHHWLHLPIERKLRRNKWIENLQPLLMRSSWLRLTRETGHLQSQEARSGFIKVMQKMPIYSLKSNGIWGVPHDFRPQNRFAIKFIFFAQAKLPAIISVQLAVCS